MLSEVQLLGAMLRDFGVGKGDRRHPLYADGAGGGVRDARLRAHRRHPFGGVRRLRAEGARDPHRRRQAQAHPLGVSCGIEGARVVPYKPLLDEAIKLAKHKPAGLSHPAAPAMRGGADARPRPRLAQSLGARGRIRQDLANACRSLATDPLYILYTSGTTGIPKGVVRDNGGHMVALKWSMENLYGVKPGEIWWCASDIGWVVGHSYIVYAPLFHGATSIMYEGKPVGTPDAGAFWRVIARAQGGGAVHRADRLPRHQEGRPATASCIGQHDLSKFRTLFLAGERADPPTIQWAEQMLNKPVIDHWWQTETGWCIAGNPVGLGALPVKYGSACVPMPGYDDRRGRRGGKASAGRHHRLDRGEAAAAARRACRRCGSRTSASARAISTNSPATTRPPTPATRTRTATSSS